MEVIENVWGGEELFNLNFEKVACSHRHIFGEKKFKCHGQDSPDLTVICRPLRPNFIVTWDSIVFCQDAKGKFGSWSHVLLMKETLQLIVCKILTICKIFAYPKWCRIFSIHSITTFCQFGGPKDPKVWVSVAEDLFFQAMELQRQYAQARVKLQWGSQCFHVLRGGRTRKTNYIISWSWKLWVMYW